MGFRFGESVTVHQDGTPTTDAGGGLVPGAVTDTTFDGVAVWPAGERSESDVVGGRLVAEVYEVAFPAGTVIHPSDRATIRGRLFQVDGEPVAWRNPLSGAAPGVVVRFRREVSGG